MEKHIKQTSLRSLLNQAVRSPQRTNGTRLETGIVTVVQTFKNKQIINVVAEVSPRFLQTI